MRIKGGAGRCGPCRRATDRVIPPDPIHPDPEAGRAGVEDEHQHVSRPESRQAAQALTGAAGVRRPERAVAAISDRAQRDRIVSDIEFLALGVRNHSHVAVETAGPAGRTGHFPIAPSVRGQDCLRCGHPAAVIAAARGVHRGLVAIGQRIARWATGCVELPCRADIDRRSDIAALREDCTAHHQQAHATGPASAP